MGCGQSKFDTDIIKFCRERKDLIKATRDSWHSLSHAHMEYLQSLENVGNEIRNFTTEALVICFDSPVDTVVVNQTVEEVPQSKDSSSVSNEDDGDLDPSNVELENASEIFSEEESTSVCEQPQIPPTNITSFVDQPHNRYSNDSLNYFPDNFYFPQTRNVGFYNSTGFGFPHMNRISFDDSVHNMPSASDFTNQQRYFPLPEDTTWENTTPFNSIEENFPNLYFQSCYETRFGDINEVREREGMPDLEDELCGPVMDVSSSEEEPALSEDSNDSLSNEAIDNGHDFNSNEIENPEASGRQYRTSPQIDETKQNATPMLVQMSTNLEEVLGCIKDAFDTIIIHGKDVSEMLKPFEPRVTLIKRYSSKGISALRRIQKRTHRKLKYADNENCEKETYANLCSLSWTLEKLYIWENKLYDEVKDEEKLRVIFDKERLKLRKLCNRGAESVKIDASQSSLKRLTPKIDVSMSKIERISRTTHQIRRDELQLQLCEYIRGCRKLSKLSFESHQKQVQAITNSQANIDTIMCMTSSSSQTAAKKLETEVIKLETTFSCWIKSHKEFVKLLKKWLLKFQEQNEVPDSNPLSPINLSTLTVSTICADWLNVLEKVSHVDVSVALKNFALMLRQLSENLQEERCHRLKLEYLSNYHELKLKRLCTENGFDWNQCAFLFREAELIGGISGNSSLDALYTNLGPVREKVHQATAKHEEVMNKLNGIATRIFRNGLIPILEALERFNLEMFGAYEQVMILNEGSAQ